MIIWAQDVLWINVGSSLRFPNISHQLHKTVSERLICEELLYISKDIPEKTLCDNQEIGSGFMP